MKTNLYSAILAASLAICPCLALAQPMSNISIDCDNISIAECSKQLPFAVVMDPAIAAHKTILRKISAMPLDGLRLMLDDSGVTNYVISFDQIKNNATVSYVSNKASGEASGVLPNVENPTMDRGEASPPLVDGGQSQQIASYPGEMSADELKARADKANELKIIDPDEEISLLGGEKVSLRQLQAKQERAGISVPAGDLNLSPVAGGEQLSYDDLKASQMRVDAAAQEVRGVTLLEGVTISPEKLKSLRELGKSTEGAAKGLRLKISASSPSEPGLVTVEQ